METTDLVPVYGIIYKCTNLINGKIYIGQTIQGLKIRKKNHIASKMHCYFHNALNKYGKENFRWEIIFSTPSRKTIDFYECYFITIYNTLDHNFGYNTKSGGSYGNPYAGKTEEEMLLTKKRMSEAKSGRIVSIETRNSLSQTRLNFSQDKKGALKDTKGVKAMKTVSNAAVPCRS